MEPLDLARISQETWIDRVHFFETVDSTNNAAIAHAAMLGEPLTELFVAEKQTGGRGRGSNQWWSDEGALTWSVLTLPIETPACQLPQVSLTMGLAICDAVDNFLAGDVALKWPNDVYLNGRKVAGILIELASGTPKRLVIGVGLNVNNSVQNAPDELRTTAISMVEAASEQGHHFDRTAVLLDCLRQIERQLNRFVNRDPSLTSDWRARSLLTGRQIRLTTPRQDITGVCNGLSDDGGLLLQTSTGTQSYYGGVVTDFD